MFFLRTVKEGDLIFENVLIFRPLLYKIKCNKKKIFPTFDCKEPTESYIIS